MLPVELSKCAMTSSFVPFGSSFGRASLRATERIDRSDLSSLVALVRTDPGGRLGDG